MRALFAPLVLALALALAPVRAAECMPTTSPAQVCPIGSAPGMPCVPTQIADRFYLDEDGCPIVGQPGIHCHWTFWIYEESNGIEGLQRADEIVDDTCNGLISGDRIVF